VIEGVRVAWRAVTNGMPRREAAWELLGELLPPDATITNPCPRCGGPHGGVRTAGADAVASVTYAGEFAVVAIADAALVASIGIDAEPVADSRRDAAGMTGVLGPGEASVRSWTRVEAALKADGRGLRVDAATVRIDDAAAGWTAMLPGAEPLEGWDVVGPDALVVSVAVKRTDGEAAVPSDRATP
jgi:4'-phosphopantetheinyl transferase